MSLTKTGVSANNTWLSKVQASVLNMLNGTASDYVSYLEANALEHSSENWQAYLSSDAYLYPSHTLLNYAFQSTYFLSWLTQNISGYDLLSEVKESDALQVLTGSATCVQGQSYTLDDEVVEGVRHEFDVLVSTDADYWYIDTYSVSDLPISCFETKDDYENLTALVSDYEGIVYFYANNGSYTQYPDNFKFVTLNVLPLDSDIGFVFYSKSDLFSHYLLYKSDWSEYLPIAYQYASDAVLPVNIADLESTCSVTFSHTNNTCYFRNLISGRDISVDYLLTSDGCSIRVYRDLDAFKAFTVGQQPYYIDTTYNYSAVNDNSITYSGDYIVDSSSTYSYDVIQNQIDNSEIITDNSVNNIVTEYITNVTNNYYSSSSGSSGDSGDSSGGSDTNIWDALSSLIGGLGDILEFIITAIAEVISLLGTFLTKIMEIVGSFEGISGDFFLFVGDFFPFIPQEIWDVILLGVTATVGICLFKAFKK